MHSISSTVVIERNKMPNTRDSSIHLDLDYKSKFTRQSFLWNATYSLNSLELGKKIVPAGAEYRKHIRSEILKKFTNENL